MGNLLKSIKQAYYRRQAQKCLEKWRRHHAYVGDVAVSRKFEMADLYADLYWFVPVNGMKQEVMYQRHTFKGIKERIEYDEQELLPDRVASAEK